MSNQPANLPPSELFRRPPAFGSPAEERQYRKHRLAATLRIFAKLGYEEGLAGHITACDPQHTGTYWANPLGVPFGHITADDLVRVDSDGKVFEGARHVNIGAFNIHVEIHQARPDVVAVAHCHSIYGRAFSTLGEQLSPITQDACPFFEDHEVFHDYTGIVLDGEDGRRIAKTLGQHKAIILKNHGLLTVGETIDAAAWWFIAMDRCCQAELLARAAGNPASIPAPTARMTRSQIGSHLVAWNSFQPMYEVVARAEPDLFGTTLPQEFTS